MNKERALLITLALIQFTHVMDFMVMMPLSTMFMRDFQISAASFGLVVASYNISAGVVSVAGAFFIDRFDRRKVMMVCFAGFTLGTLICGMSNGYTMFLAARIFTGLFGGVISSTMLSIVSDVVPLERRASAMAVVYMGFSAAAIAGVPVGSYVAAHTHWHVPFLAIAAMAALIFIPLMRYMPVLSGHIEEARKRNPAAQMLEILRSDKRMMGLLLMILLMFGHFSIIPYIPQYLVHNVGMAETDVPLIYLVGGLTSVVVMRVVGKLSDKFGSFIVFSSLSVLAGIPILAITNLSTSSLVIILLLAAALFTFGGSRGVPANTLISSTAPPHLRGGFLSLNSAMQQLGAGLASFIGGFLIADGPHDTVLNYDHVGYFAVAASLVAIPVALYIRPKLAK